ncbi:phosphatase PAP2 family protein [Aurantiacibacter odishensis]|uniref:phosphatase PAP2 family protein n=1 Tax=Aurantiacibacter odishensis TaxID=1155476 RepID=UPI000E74B344|nr:phosphatase PAP2 family protein [Aurantiacibacter odishensis]
MTELQAKKPIRLSLADIVSDNWRIMAGYGVVVALAILPAALLRFLSGRYVLPEWGEASFPFVVFSVTIAFMIAMVRPLYLVAKRHPQPTRQLIEDVRLHWPTLLGMVVMLLAVPETLEAASRFKKLIPQIQPFYLDPLLVDLERQILGMDAWRYTHAVLGAGATRVIDVIYGLWHLVNIGLLCWICLSPNRRMQLQAGICYQLAWLGLGAVLATGMASVGPCFYEHFFGRDDFAPLMARLHEIGGSEGLHSLTAMQYLLASAGTDALGGGISAMPSLHVAIAVLALLVVRDQFPERTALKLLMWAYVAVIFVGSVHLGWHYALDGVVSAVGMLLIWAAVKAFLARLLGTSVPVAKRV